MRITKEEFKETEEAFRAYYQNTDDAKDYPEFELDFEDILRRLEEVESGKRVLPPLSPTPEEWNEMVRSRYIHVRFCRWVRRLFCRK